MKRKDQLTALLNHDLGDLKKEILRLENEIQEARINLAFGKTKQVHIIRQLKRRLARGLTIGVKKLRVVQSGREVS